MSDKNLLEIKNLSVVYHTEEDDVHALSDVSLAKVNQYISNVKNNCIYHCLSFVLRRISYFALNFTIA